MRKRRRREPSTATKLVARIQRYILRISFIGILRFNCPYCGHFNQRRIGLWSWRIRCAGIVEPESHVDRVRERERELMADLDRNGQKSRACGTWFIYFLGLIPVPVGRSLSPSDHFPARGLTDRFPLGELVAAPRWLSGDAVNRVVDLHPSFCCLHNLEGGCTVGGDEERVTESHD